MMMVHGTPVCNGASTAGPVALDNGDGTWTFTFDPAPTADMEYLLVVDGVQEDLVASGTNLETGHVHNYRLLVICK